MEPITGIGKRLIRIAWAGVRRPFLAEPLAGAGRVGGDERARLTA